MLRVRAGLVEENIRDLHRLMLLTALLAVFLLGSLTFSCVSPAVADSLSLYGINFPVDEIVDVGGTAKKVVVNGNSRILPADSVQEFVVNSYFAQPEVLKHLSLSQIEDFARQALAGGAPRYAAAALSGVLQTSDPSDPKVIELIDTFAGLPGSAEAFKVILHGLTSSFSSSRIVCVLLYTVGASDMPWLRSNSVKLLYIFGGELKLYLKELYYRSVADLSSPVPDRIIKFYADAFGVDDVDFKRLSLLHVKIQRLQAGIRANDFASIIPLVDLSEGDPALSAMLGPIFLEAIHKSAEQALKNHDPDSALALLAHVDFARRTPTTHALMLRALKDLSPPNPVIIRSRELTELLVKMSDKDAVLRDTYISFLQAGVDYYLNRDLPDGSDEYLKAIIQIRPDPNKLNEAIRFEQVLSYVRREKNNEANSKLRELRLPMTFYSQVRLFMAQVRSNQENRLALSVAAILILGLIGMRFRGYLPELPNKKKRISEEELYASHSGMSDEEYQRIRPQFVTLRGGLDSANREYQRCLETFGLDLSSSLRDIKAAYRNSIKNIHPDHQKGVVDPERFIEIKAAYERLLEIRKHLGLE